MRRWSRFQKNLLNKIKPLNKSTKMLKNTLKMTNAMTIQMNNRMLGQGDGDDAHQLQELANVLTVTSKKMQSTVLGRKFMDVPEPSRKERTPVLARPVGCLAIGPAMQFALRPTRTKTRPSPKELAASMKKTAKGNL